MLDTEGVDQRKGPSVLELFIWSPSNMPKDDVSSSSPACRAFSLFSLKVAKVVMMNRHRLKRDVLLSSFVSIIEQGRRMLDRVVPLRSRAERVVHGSAEVANRRKHPRIDALAGQPYLAASRPAAAELRAFEDPSEKLAEGVDGLRRSGLHS